MLLASGLFGSAWFCRIARARAIARARVLRPSDDTHRVSISLYAMQHVAPRASNIILCALCVLYCMLLSVLCCRRCHRSIRTPHGTAAYFNDSACFFASLRLFSPLIHAGSGRALAQADLYVCKYLRKHNIAQSWPMIPATAMHTRTQARCHKNTLREREWERGVHNIITQLRIFSQNI